MNDCRIWVIHNKEKYPLCHLICQPHLKEASSTPTPYKKYFLKELLFFFMFPRNTSVFILTQGLREEDGYEHMASQIEIRHPPAQWQSRDDRVETQDCTPTNINNETAICKQKQCRKSSRVHLRNVCSIVEHETWEWLHEKGRQVPASLKLALISAKMPRGVSLIGHSFPPGEWETGVSDQLPSLWG